MGQCISRTHEREHDRQDAAFSTSTLKKDDQNFQKNVQSFQIREDEPGSSASLLNDQNFQNPLESGDVENVTLAISGGASDVNTRIHHNEEIERPMLTAITNIQEENSFPSSQNLLDCEDVKVNAKCHQIRDFSERIQGEEEKLEETPGENQQMSLVSSFKQGQRMIEESVLWTYVRKIDGQSLLKYVENGDVEIVKLAINVGNCDVNAKNYHEEEYIYKPPLLTAITHIQEENDNFFQIA